MTTDAPSPWHLPLLRRPKGRSYTRRECRARLDMLLLVSPQVCSSLVAESAQSRSNRRDGRRFAMPCHIGMLRCLGCSALPLMPTSCSVFTHPTPTRWAQRSLSPPSGVCSGPGAGAVAAAYGSHSLLDWLGSDAVAPIGVMALWPLSSDFFLSDRYWFMSVCREYWLTTCWWHNTEGVVREVLLLGPVLLAAVYFTGATVRR